MGNVFDSITIVSSTLTRSHYLAYFHAVVFRSTDSVVTYSIRNSLASP